MTPEELRQLRVSTMQAYGYADNDDFFARYISGEDFTLAQLTTMCYNYWQARDIYEYIHYAGEI
jgi:hypothetical protein